MTSSTALLALVLMTPSAPQVPAPDVRANVRDGVKWLADKQKADGSWEAINGMSQTTVTAMAGLALLMQGSTPTEGTYAAQIRKALDWMAKHAQPTGLIGGKSENEQYQYMAGHAAAILFVACAYDTDDDQDRRKKLAKLLDGAVKFAADNQTTRGGWGYISPRIGNDFDDGFSTANMLQSLLAARKVGIEVPKQATQKAIEYLVKSTNRDGGVIYSLAGGVRPMGGDGQPMNTASAAASGLMYDGTRPDPLARWVKSAKVSTAQQMQFLRTGGVFGLLPYYHMARVAYSLGETGHRKLDPEARDDDLMRWSTYRTGLFKVLKDSQGKDGSWSDPNYGPVYYTAIALVILQLDNDYIPAFSR
ncbi:MAG: hypothetical protein L0241_01815 [Planctomycetia bacterium]|nr:hypothetical protein [Planctomycetia bacterium]